MKGHESSFLLLLLVAGGFTNNNKRNVAYAKKRSTTVSLSNDVAAQWEIEGPCTGEGNAFEDPHTICFFSLSQESQTFDLELDMGETGSSIVLPNFPFLEYGSTCTTYVYREAGIYNNTFSALVSGGSKVSIEFNVPWNIYPNGTCTTGPNIIETEEGVPADNENIFDKDNNGNAQDAIPPLLTNQAESATASSATQYQKGIDKPYIFLLFVSVVVLSRF